MDRAGGNSDGCCQCTVDSLWSHCTVTIKSGIKYHMFTSFLSLCVNTNDSTLVIIHMSVCLSRGSHFRVSLYRRTYSPTTLSHPHLFVCFHYSFRSSYAEYHSLSWVNVWKQNRTFMNAGHSLQSLTCLSAIKTVSWAVMIILLW